MWDYFFTTKDGVFNWIGITGVVAIFTLALTAWDNRRKIKADLISKSRIEWMTRVETCAAQYYGSRREFVDINVNYFSYMTDIQLYNHFIQKNNHTSINVQSIERRVDELTSLCRTLYPKKIEHGFQMVQAYAELKMIIFETDNNRVLLDSFKKYDNEFKKISEDIDRKQLEIFDWDLSEVKLSEVENKINDSFKEMIPKYLDSNEEKKFIKNINVHLHNQWELAKKGK